MISAADGFHIYLSLLVGNEITHNVWNQVRKELFVKVEFNKSKRVHSIWFEIESRLRNEIG